MLVFIYMETEEKLMSLILRQNIAYHMLLYLRKQDGVYVSKILKDINKQDRIQTALEVLTLFKDIGLVTLTKTKKYRFVFITQKGREVATHLEKISKILKSQIKKY